MEATLLLRVLHVTPVQLQGDVFRSQEKETDCRFWLIWDLNESKASLSVFNEKEVDPLMENVEREKQYKNKK